MEKMAFSETSSAAGATPNHHTTAKQLSGVFSAPPSTWDIPGFPVFLFKNLESLKLARPAAVQAELLRILDKKRFDVLVASESTAEKRIAVCLSALCFAYDEWEKRERQMSATWAPRVFTRRGPTVIILSPTREHAIQTYDALAALAARGPVRTALAISGHAVGPQIMRLRNGCDVLVATPGRLMSLVGRCPITRTGLLVVDEAQTLLADSFREEMEALWANSEFPSRPGDAIDPQVLMKGTDIVDENTVFAFTCNWYNKALEKRAIEFLHDDQSLVVKWPRQHPAREMSRANSIVPYAPRRIRAFELIKHILKTYNDDRSSKTIIFTNTSAEVDVLYTKLRDLDGLVVLQGSSYSHVERDLFLQACNKDNTRVILTTDSFAAGLDFSGVQFIIQTYLPRKVTPLERAGAVVAQVQRNGHASRFGRYAWHVSYWQKDAEGRLPAWPIVSYAKVLDVSPKPRW